MRSWCKGIAALSAAIMLLQGHGAAQLIFVNSHSSWMTQRSDSLFFKAQLDTALLKNKSIKFSVTKTDGSKKKSVASKVFKVTGYTQDFNLGKAGTDILGGKSFLSIDWAVVDTNETGKIAPIGIVNLEKLVQPDTLKAHKIVPGDVKAIAAAVKPEYFQSIGEQKIAFGWNEQVFFIIAEKTANGLIAVSVDGKNAKGAFLAYSDRIITYFMQNDSLVSDHYKRDFIGDTISCIQTKWDSKAKSEKADTKVVIQVPWYDMGMVAPFIGRKIGIAAFAHKPDGSEIATLPKGAKFFIPGTWGNLSFVE